MDANRQSESNIDTGSALAKKRSPRRSAHLEALRRIRERSEFDQTRFRCFIKKIAQTPKGHVDITLTVPYEDRAQALELMNSYGVPLELQILKLGWEETETEHIEGARNA